MLSVAVRGSLALHGRAETAVRKVGSRNRLLPLPSWSPDNYNFSNICLYLDTLDSRTHVQNSSFDD